MSLLSLNDCDTGRSMLPNCNFIYVSVLDQIILESVTPNPTSHYLTLNFLPDDFQKYRVSVMDITGKELSVAVVSNNGTSMIIDVGQLTPGIYLGRAQNKYKSDVFKFIKE